MISDLGGQMQRMEDDLGSFVFLYFSIFFDQERERDRKYTAVTQKRKVNQSSVD